MTAARMADRKEESQMASNRLILVVASGACLVVAILWNVALNWFALGFTGTSWHAAFSKGSLYPLFMLFMFLPSLLPLGLGVWLLYLGRK